MGICFQDAAVHEGPGIAFVGVAENVLDVAGEVEQNFHFRPVGNPAPPRPRGPNPAWTWTISAGSHLGQGFAMPA